MCYSFGSSIFAFSIAIVTVFFMYIRQTTIDKYISPLIFAYSFMQLAEAFMWYDTKCGKLNKIGTYMAYFSLISHVLAAGIGVYFTENKIHGVLIGCLFIIYYLFKMPKMKCSKPKNTHMSWGFDPTFYRWIFVGALLIYFFSNINKVFLIFFTIWFVLTYIYFFYKQHKSKVTLKDIVKLILNQLNEMKNAGEIGSLWCNIASLGSPLLYFIQYFIK